MSDKWCGECKNAKWCKYINPYQGFYCPGMEMMIDNKTPRKEPLAADLIGEGYDGFVGKDYKEVLGSIRESKEDEHKRRHEQIMDMPDDTASDLTLKAIAALAFFYITPAKIQRVLKIAKTTFYRMFEG